jgi:hypothetical protein
MSNRLLQTYEASLYGLRLDTRGKDSPLPWGEGGDPAGAGEPGEGLLLQIRSSARNRPLTRPAPAGESAGSRTPSPQGRGQDSYVRNPSQPPYGLRLRLPLLARPNLFGGD